MDKIYCFYVLVLVVYLKTVTSYVHPYPNYPPSNRQVFGELSSDKIGYQHETRFAIPFFTREALIVFPSELNTDSPFDHLYLIRGILHINNLDDPECVPNLDIVEGGIYDRNVTLKITSGRFCAIDSEVMIHGEKAWKN